MGDERDWRVLARRELLRRPPWLTLWAEDVRLPDGRIVKDFLTAEMPDYAAVVALTLDGRVVVERNYKHGARRVCLNLPAGYLNEGEDALAAMRRELREETGYVAENWTFLGAFANDGNRGGGRGWFYLARNARQVAAPNAGDLEDLTIELLPFADLARAALNGDVAILSIAAAIGLAAIALA
jgi:ADP-ribose pyrophosphatase